MTPIAVRAVIRGRVQGVGYRQWTCREAARLSLSGWVRNRSDGAVELKAIGPADVVEQLLAACRRGPPSARVEGVERFEAEVEALSSFEERPTV